jgi:hypothetical protein
MTLTFENKNIVVVFALETIISFSRQHQYLFAAQCVWWIASTIRLERGIIQNIDNLMIHAELAYMTEAKHPAKPCTESSSPEEYGPDSVLKDCQDFLQKLASTRKQFLKKKQKGVTRQSQVKGIDKTEVQRRATTNECQRSTYPSNENGEYKSTDCLWTI